MINVTEQRLERVVGCSKRKHDESGGAALLEWRVLESGVLAVKTPLEVVTTEGNRCIWFEPRKKRLVCPHGWGQYHLGIWNGPRAADFPKPAWTTCQCKSATGLCARKKLREEVAPGAPAPSYYETLVAAQGTTELRPGLLGARVPGVVGADGGAFYMVKGDAASVLRCRHGQTTHTLGAQARERQRHAAGLVAAALLGHRVAGKALGGGATGLEDTSASRGTRRVLVRLVVVLHAAREARRARRGGVVACGCAPVFVKACVRG
jgi:hypothetical protein